MPYLESENFAALLLPGLRTVFVNQYRLIPAITPLIFNMQGSQKAVENNQSIGEVGTWEEFEGTLDYDGFDRGFQSTYTHVEFARGMTIERKLIDDDQYNVIMKKAARLGLGAARKRENDGAGLFNNAFNVSFPGPDAVALCSSTHDLSPTNTTNWSNIGTTALGHQAIIDTRLSMRAFTDDRSELIAVNPDLLLIPPELEAEAFVLMQSANKPGTADNDINFLSSRFRVIVWDYLTDANNWFLMDSGYLSQFLNWYDRIPVEFDSERDFDTLRAKFRGYMRYSFGWDDPHFIFGNEVA